MIPTPPTPYVRSSQIQLDDEPTFTSPINAVPNVSTNKWTINTTLIVHNNQLDGVATAIEKLYLQDFDQPTEINSFEIDPVLDTDGVTVLNAGFTVELVQTNDQPSGINVGPLVASVGLAWSLRSMIRDNLGIGTPYVPPTP
jgi:hypothetical protein